MKQIDGSREPSRQGVRKRRVGWALVLAVAAWAVRAFSYATPAHV